MDRSVALASSRSLKADVQVGIVRSSAVWGWAAAIVGSTAWALLIWAVHHGSPRTLISFHGMLHAAVAERFLDGQAAFPPEDPFFAGQSLPYYWFFQYLAAAVARLTDWNVFYALEAVIIVSTVILGLAAVRLGLTLYGRRAAGPLMTYLVIAGTNPLGIVFGIAAYAILSVINPALLRDRPDYLWGVVNPIYSLIRFNDFGGLYGPLLNFFLNVTARPTALAASMLVVLCLERALRHGGALALLMLAGASALLTALSPIQGIPVAGSLGAALGGVWLWRRWTRRGPNRYLRLLPALLAVVSMLVGVAVAWPTYWHLVLGPSEKQAQFWLFSVEGAKNLATVVLSVGPLAALSIWGTRAAPRERQPFLVALLVGAGVLLLGCVAVSLPAGNNSNFFHSAVVLLAVPAAGILLAPPVRLPRLGAVGRGRLAGLVALVFLPTTLLLLAAYVNRPPVPVDFDALRPQRTADGTGLGDLYGWIQASTPLDAVFVVDPRRRVTVAGNTAELPAMTRRSILTEELAHYVVDPFPDAARRVELAERVTDGEPPTAADRAYVSALGRPTYLVHVDGGAASPGIAARMEAVYGPPVFSQGNVAVFRWPT